MDDNLKIKKLYQDLEKFKSRKFNCYVDNEDERHGKLCDILCLFQAWFS